MNIIEYINEFPFIQNISINHYEPLLLEYELIDDGTGDPIPLTGTGILTGQLRNEATDQVVLDLDPHIIVTNASNGLYKIDIPQSVAATISPGTYRYDIFLRNSTAPVYEDLTNEFGAVITDELGEAIFVQIGFAGSTEIALMMQTGNMIVFTTQTRFGS
jgi:hypothetical protein